MTTKRHQSIERMIDKLTYLRDGNGDDSISMDDLSNVFDVAGGLQEGDLEWLSSKYTITVELTDKGRADLERIVTELAITGERIVTRFCTCGCGAELTGNGKQRFATAACKQRVYRDRAAHKLGGQDE